jgi:hypothetical protein
LCLTGALALPIVNGPADGRGAARASAGPTSSLLQDGSASMHVRDGRRPVAAFGQFLRTVGESLRWKDVSHRAGAVRARVAEL